MAADGLPVRAVARRTGSAGAPVRRTRRAGPDRSGGAVGRHAPGRPARAAGAGRRRSGRPRSAGRTAPQAAGGRTRAVIWAARSTRSGPRWTRLWPPSVKPWPGRTTTAPGSRRWSWRRCPTTSLGRFAGLSDYEWRSPEARQTYEQIKQMLQREVLDAQFAGMKQALESPDPEAMQRVKDMLADLNALLAAHARNEDTDQLFAEFMANHGEFFPEQPENVEELIDALARRQAAAQRMMASLSPEQREQMAQLMQQALRDADLASEMAQLSDNLRALRPGLDRESPSGMRSGGDSLGYSEAVEAVAELADLEALSRSAVPEPSRLDPGRRGRGDAGAATRWRGCGRSAGAARPGAGAGAAGLPDPHRRRAAAHPASRAPAGPDCAEAGFRPDRRGRSRRPRRPSHRCCR